MTSDAVVVPNPTGLHARPAAVLSQLAQKYESTVALKRGDDQANAKSVMAIMGLEVYQGHKVQVVAHGPDAAQAAEELAEALREGLGEEGVVPVSEASGSHVVPAPAAAAVRPARRSEDPNLLLGVAASPGLGVGRVLRVHHEDIQVKEYAADRHKERRLLNEALDRAMVQLEALENRLRQDADPDKAMIFAAHREILRDPDLLDIASSAIDKGKSAAFAWRRAYTTYADRLAGLTNELLAQRATDVRDVGQRVLEEVTGQRREKADIPEGTILIAEDLTPSDTASLDRTKVVGFCTQAGGASSHVSILARSLDIPAVAGIEPRALDIADGTLVILDGAKGTLRMNVTEDDVARIRARQERLAARRAEELAHADEPAVTGDGHHVEVVANIGGLDDAREATTKGAEGVGLLRSEFVFLGRTKAPTEDEQAEIYTAIARTLAPGQPLVIRTLDVGGDKPLPYMPMAPEENPFLGERGIRVGLNRPEVLRTQVRAILRAADAGAKINVMFPMIATIEDFRQAKAIFEEERAALGVAPIPVGIMVEVPSVAVMAPQFAAEVDFFSVGTNDLTQYTLAMDRGHPKLAPQVDGLNPAVLGLIALAAKAAHDGRPVDRGLRRHGVGPPGRADPPRARRRRAERQHSRDPGRQGPDPVPVPRAVPGAGRPRTHPGLRGGGPRTGTGLRRRGGRVMTTATETAPAPRKASLGSRAFGFLQKIGKSVMLPVSVLPVAGILLGVGGAFIGGYQRQRPGHGYLHPRRGRPRPAASRAPSATRSPRGSSRKPLYVFLQVLQASGAPIFGAMALIFAIGVALGLTKNDGVAALAATIGYLVMNGTLGVVAAARGVETTADPRPGHARHERLRRHPHRRHRGLHVQPVLPHPAPAVSGLLRGQAVRPDRHGVRGDRRRDRPGLRLAAHRLPHRGRRERSPAGEHGGRRVRLRHRRARPAAVRAAPHLERPVLLHPERRRLERLQRHPDLLLRRAPGVRHPRRRVPDQDVRPVRRGPGDLAGGAAREPRAHRVDHAGRGADRLPHRDHRAAGVLVPVRRTAALRGARVPGRARLPDHVPGRAAGWATRSPKARSTTSSSSPTASGPGWY